MAMRAEMRLGMVASSPNAQAKISGVTTPPLPDYSGMLLQGTPWVAPGTMYVDQARQVIYFHERSRSRWRKRRPHGRGRPAKRRWRLKVVRHSELDRILKEVGRERRT